MIRRLSQPDSPPHARRTSPVLLSVLLLLTGCTVGPDYERPAVELGDGWAEPAVEAGGEPAGAVDDPVDLSHWWTALGDPTLERLVQEALEGNLELRRATARVAEARALLDAAAGGRYPQVGSGGGVTVQRWSEEGFFPIDRIPGFERDQTIYQAGFDASWEADLFGRVRRSIEAAEARLGETHELRRAARMTVAAEVARIYLDLRGAQRRLAALEHALAAARETRRLVELQVRAGEVAEAQLAGVEADLTALEARLPGVEGEIRTAALALGVVGGELPESELALADAGATRGIPEPLPLPALPVGERADLLRRRPDVRAAERRLAAATAEIGVATAELFPRLSISAGGGFEAMDLAELGSSGSERWTLVPFLSWRIFDGGRVRAQIRATEARAETAAVGYEQAVIEALGDAERSLTRYRHASEALERQRRAVAAAGRQRHFARLRHEAGEVPLFELLDAEASLARAREAEATAHARAATALVAVFKALGGGWGGGGPSRVEPPALR